MLLFLLLLWFFSLSLIFTILCLNYVHLIWNFLGFLDLVSLSFPRLRKFWGIISSNNFSDSFSSPSGTPIMKMQSCLMFYKCPLGYLHLFFFFFPILLLCLMFCIVFSSSLPIHTSLSTIWLLDPSNVFFSSVINLFGIYIFYLFVQILTVLLHFSLKNREHLYDHYFKFLIW